MWKVQTEEREQLCSMFLVLTQDDRRLFVIPIVVHQETLYSRDIQFNIPMEWILHHTKSGCTDIYSCFKALNQCSTVCGASTTNNQIIIFNGHDNHLNYHTLSYM